MAEAKFEIPPVVDAEDVVEEPEEHSIMTYVSYFRDYLENHAKKEEERLRKTADPQFCRAFGPGLDNGRTNIACMFTIETRNCFDQILTKSDPEANLEAVAGDEKRRASRSSKTSSFTLGQALCRHPQPMMTPDC